VNVYILYYIYVHCSLRSKLLLYLPAPKELSAHFKMLKTQRFHKHLLKGKEFRQVPSRLSFVCQTRKSAKIPLSLGLPKTRFLNWLLKKDTDRLIVQCHWKNHKQPVSAGIEDPVSQPTSASKRLRQAQSDNQCRSQNSLNLYTPSVWACRRPFPKLTHTNFKKKLRQAQSDNECRLKS
jgi:hypothetical protein